MFEVKEEMDAIFTTSVWSKVIADYTAQNNSDENVLVQKLAAKERYKARVVSLLTEKFESIRILPENKKTSKRS